MHEQDLLSSELLATVSHELRSPLTVIKGYATTLLRHASCLSRHECSEFLLAISEASDRLDQLIGRLLELAQLENGSITFAPVPIDSVRLAAEALRSAEQSAARQTPLLFTFQLCLQTAQGEEAERVPLIQVDPRLLREVLDNLLENAVKYSPQGGVVRVFLRPTTDEGIASILPCSPHELGKSVFSGDALAISSERDQPAEFLEIGVCDQGIGIAAEHLTRVFESFYQVDRGLTREVNGAGLGLSICKRIMELHCGRIWVESRLGEGSTFHLVVPIPANSPPEQV